MSFYGHHVHGGDKDVAWLLRVLEPDDVLVLVSLTLSVALATSDVFIMFLEGATEAGCYQAHTGHEGECDRAGEHVLVVQVRTRPCL